MSYGWLALSIIMGIFSVFISWLVFVLFSKTVPEPDFMEEDRGTVDQTEARRIHVSRDMGQIVDLEV